MLGRAEDKYCHLPKVAQDLLGYGTRENECRRGKIKQMEKQTHSISCLLSHSNGHLFTIRAKRFGRPHTLY